MKRVARAFGLTFGGIAVAVGLNLGIAIGVVMAIANDDPQED